MAENETLIQNCLRQSSVEELKQLLLTNEEDSPMLPFWRLPRGDCNFTDFIQMFNDSDEVGQLKIKEALPAAISEWKPTELKGQGEQGEEIFKDLLYIAVEIKDKNSFLECMRVADKGVLADDAFWRVVNFAATEVDFDEHDEEIKTILTKWYEDEAIYQEHNSLLLISLLKFDPQKIGSFLPKLLNFLDVSGSFDIEPSDLVEGIVYDGGVDTSDLRLVLSKSPNKSAKKLLSVIPA